MNLHVPKSLLRLLMNVGLFVPAAFAAEQGAGSSAVVRLICHPIFEIVTTDGKRRLFTDQASGPSSGKETAFLAVVSEFWLEGFVPLFGIERDGRFELRRRPLRGQENLSEPLFFGRPLPDELESAKIAGRWDCLAAHADGVKKYLGFELTTEDRALIGRFDQSTDYRFAFITGGTFRTNRVELAIDYAQDRYTMTGEWRNGKLAGTWQQIDADNHGTWEASRPEMKLKFEPPAKPVPLYEWRRASDGERHYSVATTLKEPGWERTTRPLCLVWPK